MTALGLTAGFPTPVALFIFNRPDATAAVFDRIAGLRPRHLLVVADGPRPGRLGEGEQCAAARSIVNRVDWPCELLINFSDVNLGCKRRVSTGLDWVFSTVNEAIILEDDCIPDASFFFFCQELLGRFRDDERIAMISGDNFQPAPSRKAGSYYFSHYTHIWGWASWRRAWRHYDVEMRLWPTARNQGVLRDILDNSLAYLYWRDIFDAVHSGRIDTWDYQWTFACWMNRGLSVMPAVNLVSNIGFGPEATHTTKGAPVMQREARAMTFPLVHPPFMVCDTQADRYTQSALFGGSAVRSLVRLFVNCVRRRRWAERARAASALQR